VVDGRPPATNQTIAASITTTIPTCSRPVCLAPTRFTTTSRAASPSATGLTGSSNTYSRYGTPPTSASAPLNDSENHVPTPAMVPSSGPIPRSM
jgi:hypothetical protein